MKKALLLLFLTILIGYLLPQKFVMPVKGASARDYHAQSFWYYPWGKSVTHKGVDIFAKAGTPVVSSTQGFVVYTGQWAMGGNIILILGPKWRLHYYAHLQEIDTQRFSVVKSGESIGKVGTSGNAQGKSPHLHYSIVTTVPYFWRIDTARQGWKKMFYLNPIDYL